MVNNYLSLSCYNAFRLQTRKAGASHQIDQRSCSADNEDDSALLRTFSIEAQRPTSATPEATLPKKTPGFAPDSVFTREFTRSLPNYLMAGGWHDDVVDMMVSSDFF